MVDSVGSEPEYNCSILSNNGSYCKIGTTVRDRSVLGKMHHLVHRDQAIQSHAGARERRDSACEGDRVRTREFVVSQDEDDSLDGMAWGGRHAGFASPEQLPNGMKRCVPTFIPGSYALVYAYWQDNRWRLSYKNHSTV